MPAVERDPFPRVLAIVVAVTMLETIVYLHAIRSRLNLRDDPLGAIIVFELVLAVVLGALWLGRSRAAVALIAGTAFASAAACLIMFTLITGLSGIGTGRVPPPMAGAWYPLCATNVALMAAAMWRGRRALKSFALGVVSIMVVCPVCYALTSVVVGGLDVGSRNRASVFPTAIRAVDSLTASLMRQRAASADRSFPESLVLAVRIPDYTLSYTPRRDASGRVTDFRLSAVPRRKRIEGADPIMSDSQGVVFQYMYWSTAGYEPPRSNIAEGRLSQSGLPALLDMISYHVRQHDATPMDSVVRAAARDSTLYRVEYIAGDGDRFALASTCRRYGEWCLRSFFRDYGGDVHVTAEPRPATTDDPLVPPGGYDGARLPADTEWVLR